MYRLHTSQHKYTSTCKEIGDVMDVTIGHHFIVTTYGRI